MDTVPCGAAQFSGSTRQRNAPRTPHAGPWSGRQPDVTPVMDQYERGSLLGRGAFGAVYHATRKSDSTECAIKHILAGTPEQRATIMGEVKVLQGLHHPGIVRCLGAHEDELTIAIVMEYLPGGDLEKRLLSRPDRALPPGMLVPLIRGMLEALEYLHLRGMVHRDLKPSNILLAADDTPRLADFGLARELSDSGYASTATGTKAFMAPEVLNRSGRYNAAVDVWSVGATLYYLLSGGKFLGMSDVELADIVRGGAAWRMPALPASVPAAMSSLVSRMLRVVPSERASVLDLLSDPALAVVSVARAPAQAPLPPLAPTTAPTATGGAGAVATAVPMPTGTGAYLGPPTVRSEPPVATPVATPSATAGGTTAGTVTSGAKMTSGTGAGVGVRPHRASQPGSVAKLENTRCTGTLKGHTDSVKCVVALPDGRVASGSDDKTIKLWDVVTGACVRTLSGHTSTVFALACLPDGRLVSGSWDKSLKVWNTATGKCLATLTGHTYGVWTVAAVGGARVASGSHDGTIMIWDVDTGDCLATLSGHTAPVRSLALLPDGRLASGSIDSTVKLWNMDTRACTATLSGHTGGVYCLAVLSDGCLATGSFCTIKLWNTSTCACVGTLSWHSAYVGGLAVLPTGQLASGSYDETVKLWDTASGDCTATLIEHSAGVNALAVLASGQLVSASDDKTLRVWGAPPGSSSSSSSMCVIA